MDPIMIDEPTFERDTTRVPIIQKNNIITKKIMN